MSLQSSLSLLRNGLPSSAFVAVARQFHTSPVCERLRSGRYRRIPGRARLLTYENSLPPNEIIASKTWNSWNTTNLLGGRRSQLTTIEDLFIRRFMSGTWFGNLLGDQVIIKRQHNIIRIAACAKRELNPGQMYFLIGFCEEMLTNWLHCPVKLEIQTIHWKEGYVKVI